MGILFWGIRAMCLVCGCWISLTNWIVVWNWLLHRKHGSPFLILGGVLGTIGLSITPVNLRWYWIPLVVDLTIPAYG